LPKVDVQCLNVTGFRSPATMQILHRKNIGYYRAKLQ
jgi:hypothetical protein